jgi:hypothetical protein
VVDKCAVDSAKTYTKMLLFKNNRNVLKNTLFNVTKVVLAQADRLEFHFGVVDFLQSC